MDDIYAVVEAIKVGNMTPDEIQRYSSNDLGGFLGVTGTYSFSGSRKSLVLDGISVLSIENNAWNITSKRSRKSLQQLFDLAVGLFRKGLL